jgi:prepilin-type N-terminal cleavage/methylation domain-containing protein
MKRRAENTLGMSLVELMIVVVIIGILAAISVVGYRKYIARARLSEATAMLAEFVAKEQLYFLDSGQYMEAHRASADYPSTSENSSEFWPQDPNLPFDSARTPVSVYGSGGSLPNSWRTLGIRPRWQQLFCTYLVNAGAPLTASSDTPLPFTVGGTLWASQPRVPWFYAMAACNLGGPAGWASGSWPDNVTVLVLTHDSQAIRTTEEKQ